MNEFDRHVIQEVGSPIHGINIEIFQVNVGLVCNQECIHCHVASSPRRKEIMSWEIMTKVLDAANQVNCRFVDITGGAPELNPNFKQFVKALIDSGKTVQVRTNLTVLLEPEMHDIPEFYRENKVQLVASLPCYLEENVEKQRGLGVYKKSMDALKLLNGLGYGNDPDLQLNLVYNPLGPVLPPSQESLEGSYRKELYKRFGIVFTNLITIANMPIGRFRTDLKKQNREDEYMKLLKDNFNTKTLDGLMCRHQIEIDWDGNIYDCDFNLALRMKVNHSAPNNIRDFDPKKLTCRQIMTGDHCFGCTAGAGSSCSGAIA
jgi:radical SAM/Cys-rich protein